MEAGRAPAEASEPSGFYGKQEAQCGVSTQEVKAGTGEEVSEAFKTDLEGSEKLIPPPRIINLKRDLQALVTNIQTAVDTKESMRRTEMEEARRLRLEKLEDDVKSSQEKYEAISGGWSMEKEKVIPQELQEALNLQQELCAALTEDKKQLISDLQQELKVGDNRYIKDLRRQEEELDLMMERMENQIQTLTKAYREELVQMERVYQQETKVLLTEDKSEWEQRMKELLGDELERLRQRRQAVEEYEGAIHSLMLENMDKYSLAQIEHNAKFQALERENQQLNATRTMTRLKEIKQKDEAAAHKFNLVHMKSRISSQEKELKKLLDKYSSQEKYFTKKCRDLSEDYKRHVQQSERIQRKMRHLAAADERKLEEMWAMLDAEVRRLAERALVVDSLICKQHLGVAWERPPAEPLAWTLEARPESVVVETCEEATLQLSMETLNRVKELLCDEAGFLIEESLLNLLTPMKKEKQAVVKLCSLLNSFGLGEEDLPELALHLLRYQQTEDVCGAAGESGEEAENSATRATSELIDPNRVLPALKSFLEQRIRSRNSSAPHTPSLLDSEDQKPSGKYWEDVENVISDDKLRLWDAAEISMKQYHAILAQISELVPETQSLEQQNMELRMLLQQTLASRVTS